MRRQLLARLPIGRVTHAYRRLLGEVENARAAQQLAPLVTRYLPVSEKTLNAFHLQYVCHEISTADVEPGAALVEFGAGASTPILAKAAALAGVGFVSVEHDPKWQALVAGWMRDEDLDPGTIHQVDIDPPRRWFDHDGVDRAIDGRRV